VQSCAEAVIRVLLLIGAKENLYLESGLVTEMQMKKSYQMIRAHDHGRCPSLEEYRTAIFYASRFNYAVVNSLRIHIATSELSNQIWDWYEEVTSGQPADWDNFKDQFQQMLIYYWVPFGNEYEDINERMMDAMIHGDGDSWGPLEPNKIWNLYRDHLSSYLLHVGYVTSYLKNQGFTGQTMCSQVGKYVSSWNRSFGSCFGKSMPLMLVAHHTHPHVVNSRMLTWTHTEVYDGDTQLGETHHAGERVESQNFILGAADNTITPITLRAQIPPGVQNMERYYERYSDTDEYNAREVELPFPRTTVEGIPID